MCNFKFVILMPSCTEVQQTCVQGVCELLYSIKSAKKNIHDAPLKCKRKKCDKENMAFTADY